MDRNWFTRLIIDQQASFFQAWHAWAYMNYEAVLFYKQQRPKDDAPQAENGAESTSAEAAQKEKSDLVRNSTLVMYPYGRGF